MHYKDELAAYTDKQTYTTEHIIKSPVIYTVCYEEHPIEIKTGHLAEERTRNRRTVFTSERQAHRLAERLNSRYMTDKFKVERLTTGDTN